MGRSKRKRGQGKRPRQNNKPDPRNPDTSASRPNRGDSKSKPSADQAARADLATTCWMLAVLTTLACEVGAFALRGLISAEGEPFLLAYLAGILGVAAIVIGAISLLMTLLVVRRGVVIPPRVIVIAAVVIGLVPWIEILWRALAG